MASQGLTDLGIRALKPKAKQYEVPDPGARGLWVVVFPSSKKSFVVRYRFAGLPKKLTLKAGISLAAAHKEAADALYEVSKDRDPAEAKKAAKKKTIAAKADTVQAICENYIEREGKKLRTVGDREVAFKRLVYPEIGKLQIEGLKRSRVVMLLDKIEDESGPRMADLVLRYLGKVFNWHASRADDFRSPLVKGMTRHEYVPRERVLDDDELKAVWKAAGEGEGPFPALIKFLLLTGARRDEAADMTWDEIGGDDWTLPSSRNGKTGLDHVRPLSAAALSALPEQIDDCPFVFTTKGKKPLSGFSKFKKAFDKASGTSGWRLHDLRRTARTLMSRAGVSKDHGERALGHVMGVIRGTYDKHEYYDEKKLAFDALARLIESIVNPQDNVVTMKSKRGAKAAV